MNFLKKRFKGILKNKRSPGAWENLELRPQLQLRVPAQYEGNYYYSLLGKLSKAPKSGSSFEKLNFCSSFYLKKFKK